MKLDLGGGVTIDILFPNRDVSSWETNEGCIVAKLSYGNISVMLTGDAPVKTEKIIIIRKYFCGTSKYFFKSKTSWI